MKTLQTLKQIRKALLKHKVEGAKSNLSIFEVAILKDYVLRVEQQLELAGLGR